MKKFVPMTALASLVACSLEPEVHVGTTRSAVVNAQLVSQNLPVQMNPGERLNVQVQMLNNGTAAPADNWTAGNFYLYSRNTPINEFAWVYDPLLIATPVGSTGVFDFVLTAPATNPNVDFSARMLGMAFFGANADVNNINVNAANPRRWSCNMVSTTIPAAMNPGESRLVNVTVSNNGTGTWVSPGLCLYSRDNLGVPSNINKWGGGATCVPVTLPVAPTQTFAFNFQITAPVTPGLHTFWRQILDSNPTSPAGGIGIFDLTNHCVDLTVNVGGTAPLDSALVSQNFPVLMAPSETRAVSVQMRNTGTEPWLAAGGNYALYSENNPLNLWNIVVVPVTADTPTNGVATINFNVTAPVTPGPYAHVWRMRKLSGVGAGSFGATINVPVTVDPGAMPGFDAAVVSQNIPAAIAAGANAVFTITMRNTGTSDWMGINFQLFTQNTPAQLWTTNLVALGAAETVAAGATKVFTFNVVAPTVPGLYNSLWRMNQAGGVGLFGATAITNGITVTACGDGTTIPPAEACDDGNNMPGDGCSATCQIEPEVVDLAGAPADRTILGSQVQMSNVAIGDVTTDNVPDVIVGERSGFSPMGGGPRALAGRVFGYSSGAGFFTGGTTTVPTGSMFEIQGAEAFDGLGGGALGGVKVGDVTGDGVADVIVSAPDADGDLNGRLSAGEVYVITGGAGLTTAGAIDLAATPASPFLRARIIGARAGDGIRILAVGNLNGDAALDLLIGMPGDDSTAPNAGGAVAILGGVDLVGTIDLLVGGAAVLATIRGAAAGDQLGESMGAVGDFGGGAEGDVLLGSSRASPGGRNLAGAAWGVFGPLAGNYDLGTQFSIRFFGAAASDNLGRAVAIGQVTGNATQEVVIGAPQARNAGTQVGSVDVWVGPVAAGTYDLSAGATPTARVFGREFGDLSGQALALGDMNGDGFLDLPIVAAAGDGPTNGRDRAGEVSIVLGAANMAVTTDLAVFVPGILVYGPNAGALMGLYPNTVEFGDLDLDGRMDLAIGSFNAGGGAGRIDFFQSNW